MEGKFRFGIMGAGNITRQFCDAVQRTGIAVVAAVAGRTPGKAAKLAEEFQIPGVYEDYEEMLKKEQLDAVYIAVTTNAHYELAMLCLDYRMPVLCEKAMFRTYQEAKTVFDRSSQLGVFVMEGMWSRFLPKMAAIRRWIAEGRIGKVTMAQVDIGFQAPLDPQNRYFNRDLGGGAMYDLTVYCYDILTGIMEKPVKEVDIQTIWTDTDVDGAELLQVKMDGCLARLAASFLTDLGDKAVFFGSKGRIEMKNPHYGQECWLYEDGKEPEVFAEDHEENGFVYEIREVVNCVRSGVIESQVAPHSMTLEASRLYDRILETKEAAEVISLSELA